MRGGFAPCTPAARGFSPHAQRCESVVGAVEVGDDTARQVVARAGRDRQPLLFGIQADLLARGPDRRGSAPGTRESSWRRARGGRQPCSCMRSCRRAATRCRGGREVGEGVQVEHETRPPSSSRSTAPSPRNASESNWSRRNRGGGGAGAGRVELHELEVGARHTGPFSASATPSPVEERRVSSWTAKHMAGGRRLRARLSMARDVLDLGRRGTECEHSCGAAPLDQQFNREPTLRRTSMSAFSDPRRRARALDLGGRWASAGPRARRGGEPSARPRGASSNSAAEVGLLDVELCAPARPARRHAVGTLGDEDAYRVDVAEPGRPAVSVSVEMQVGRVGLGEARPATPPWGVPGRGM